MRHSFRYTYFCMKAPFKFLPGLAACLLLAVAALPPLTHGDTPSDLQKTSALLDDLTAQQVKLVENQAKMDEKIALIAEEVRQARLFAARGGKGK